MIRAIRRWRSATRSDLDVRPWLVRGAPLLTAAWLAQPAAAEPLWSFAHASGNHLDWSARTSAASGKRDFSYLEIEAGAGYAWGEAYGFFDLENPLNGRHEAAGRERRTAAKALLRHRIGSSPFEWYGQIYDLRTSGFHEQNRIVGLGANLTLGSVRFKPFLGAHQVDASHFQGANGAMLGWLALVDLTLGGRQLQFSHWHETEFARDAEYLRDARGRSRRVGHNGALSLWLPLAPRLAAGLHFRYADDKLGAAVSQRAMIYSLRWTF